MEIEEAKNKILQGDCIEFMKKLPDNSVDTVITDPPYGLSFMGKEWDSYTDNEAFQEWTRRWAKEALKVAKPGATLLCFGGTRTFHRIMCGLEDAGWEIVDTMMWMYGTGFPKAQDISKMIDKREGAEREVVGRKKSGISNTKERKRYTVGASKSVEINITTPATPEAKKWDGYKTHALKPAYEPIIMARKPNDGCYVDNAFEYDVAGLNIDEGRIGYQSEEDKEGARWGSHGNSNADHNWGMNDQGKNHLSSTTGRYPANIILECTCDEVKEGEEEVEKNIDFKSEKQSEMGWGTNKCITKPESNSYNIHTDPNCPCYILDKQSGFDCCQNGKVTGKEPRANKLNKIYGDYRGYSSSMDPLDSKGGASRFFKQVRPDRFKYTSKASKEERNLGCEMLDTKNYGQSGGARQSLKKGEDEYQKKEEASCGLNTIKKVKNDHPTVKPIDLLKYLCKLTKTPEGGVVLDPFIGSGTTAIACVLTDRDYIGIDKTEEYIEIAKARLNYWKKPKHRREAYKKRKKRKKKNSKNNKKLGDFIENE